MAIRQKTLGHMTSVQMAIRQNTLGQITSGQMALIQKTLGQMTSGQDKTHFAKLKFEDFERFATSSRYRWQVRPIELTLVSYPQPRASLIRPISIWANNIRPIVTGAS